VLQILILAVLLTFLAIAALWIALLFRRAGGRRSAGLKRSGAREILESIRRFRQTGDRAALVDAVARLDAAVLLELVPRALAELRGDERDAFETALARRRFAQHLRTRFERFDESRRILACELLAVLGGERSVGFLFAAMRDASFRVRIAAAVALAQRAALTDLRAALADLGKRGRRSARLVQMFHQLLPGAQREVEAIAADVSQDPFVRVSALRALAARSGLDEEILLRLSQDPSPVVAVAVGALAIDYRYPAAPLVLERMLASRSPAVRREAAARAQALQSSALAPRLQDALRDRDFAVASAAARAIVAARRSPAERPLLLQPPPPQSQAASADAFLDK
jgi:hypothetical protein